MGARQEPSAVPNHEQTLSPGSAGFGAATLAVGSAVIFTKGSSEKRRLLAWAVLAFSTVSISLALVGRAGEEPTGQPEDATLIRKVFEDYKAALIAGDGEAAVALVDQGTLDYFAELKRLSLEGSEKEVRRGPFIDRLLVVTIRHLFQPDQVAALGLDELIQRAVGEGWISPTTVAQLEIGEVSIDGDLATAEVLTAVGVASSNDTPSAVQGLTYRFVREEHGWRFGFSSLVEGLNGVISQFTEMLGTEEDALIFLLVENLSGQKVLPEIWQTPP